jgi:hypothetical protein
LTPWRSGKVSSVPSSFHAQLGGQVRNDRFHAVLRHVLLIHDKIVEHTHHWAQGRERRFLVQRHAGRAVEKGHSQNAALLLGECRISGGQRQHQRPGCCEHAKISLHLHLPPVLSRGPLSTRWHLAGPFAGLHAREQRSGGYH